MGEADALLSSIVSHHVSEGVDGKNWIVVSTAS
jgi:hypothetical protein